MSEDEGRPDGDQRRHGTEKDRPSRLTKTAAGLALILGTGGTAGVLAGAEASATTGADSSRPPAAVARVVDMARFTAQRRSSSTAKGPDGPTDDGGPPAAA
jgi:hypothetical protein